MRIVARSRLLPDANTVISETVEQLNLRTLASISRTPTRRRTLQLFRRPRRSRHPIGHRPRPLAQFAYRVGNCEGRDARDARSCDLIVMAVAGSYLEIVASNARVSAAQAQVKTAEAVYQRGQSIACRPASTRASTPPAPTCNCSSTASAYAPLRPIATAKSYVSWAPDRPAARPGLQPRRRFSVRAAPLRKTRGCPRQCLPYARRLAGRRGRRTRGRLRRPGRSRRTPAQPYPHGRLRRRRPAPYELGPWSLHRRRNVDHPALPGRPRRGRRGGASGSRAPAAASRGRRHSRPHRSGCSPGLHRSERLGRSGRRRHAQCRALRRHSRQSRDRFLDGVADTVEVVQAEQSVVTAQDDYINAVFDYNLAKISLARAIGDAKILCRNTSSGNSHVQTCQPSLSERGHPVSC